MNYKISKGTSLYDKLDEMMKKITYCNEKALELALSQGAFKVATTGRFVGGGLDGFVFKDGEIPDDKLWMRPDRHKHPYILFPRSGVKANIELHEKIRSLPVVGYDEFNDVIQFSDKWVGLTWFKRYSLKKSKDCFLIKIPDECEYDPIDEMIEILNSEYKKLASETL